VSGWDAMSSRLPEIPRPRKRRSCSIHPREIPDSIGGTPMPRNAILPPMATEKTWQARIGGISSELAERFVESVSYDWRLYKQDVAGSIAHATMLAKVGLITDADLAAITAGLKEIEAEI